MKRDNYTASSSQYLLSWQRSRELDKQMVMTFTGHRATQQLPDNRITSRSYNHLCVTFVLWTWAATRHPRRQHWRWPCWHTRTIHMETCVCIIELLTTERININVCQIPTELTVNIVTVTQDRNLAVMKLKREMLLWMKNKYVTCYDNDNHGLKVIVEHQSMLIVDDMMITTSEPEPDKRYPNSKF